LRDNEIRIIKNRTVEVYVDYRKFDPIYNIPIPADIALYDLNETGFRYIGSFAHIIFVQD
jgi:hypothetical protein